MRNVIGLSASVLMLLCMAFSQTEPCSKRTISTFGTSQVLIAPDFARASLEVNSDSRDARKAKAINDAAIKKVISVAMSNGVASDDVLVEHISLSAHDVTPKREGTSWEPYTVYTATQRIQVTIKNLASYDALILALVEAGVNDISSVSFETSTLVEQRDKARLMAFQAAKRKAEALVKEAGMVLGKPCSIQLEGTPLFSMNGLGPSYGANSAAVVDVQSVVPGKIQVKETVNVTFEITE